MIFDFLIDMSDERLTLLLDSLGDLQRNDAWILIQKEHVAERRAYAEMKVFFVPATEMVAVTEAQTVWKEAVEIQNMAVTLKKAINIEQEKRAVEAAKKGKG